MIRRNFSKRKPRRQGNNLLPTCCSHSQLKEISGLLIILRSSERSDEINKDMLTFSDQYETTFQSIISSHESPRSSSQMHPVKECVDVEAISATTISTWSPLQPLFPLCIFCETELICSKNVLHIISVEEAIKGRQK